MTTQLLASEPVVAAPRIEEKENDDAALFAGTIECLVADIRRSKNDSRGRAAADRLHFELKALPRSHATNDRLQALLDGGTLGTFVDSWDLPCEAAVLGAQVALGHPWALEIKPERLEWLRRVSEERDDRISRACQWPMALALPSVAWNGFLAVAMATNGIGISFAVGAAHAVAAFTTGLFARRVKSHTGRVRAAAVFHLLGWSWLCGPISSLVLAITHRDPSVFTAGMFVAFPAMLTAWSCFGAANRLQPQVLEAQKTEW